MVRLQILAQYPVDHLIVVSSLIVFLRQVAAFAYCVIDYILSTPNNLYLLFCCVLSILALIWFVLMMLLCATARRFSLKVSFS